MLVRYIGCRRWEDALQKWCWAFVMLVTSTTVTIAADAPLLGNLPKHYVRSSREYLAQ